MKLSEFYFSKKIDEDRYILYNSMKMNMYSVNKKEKDEIEKLIVDDELSSELMEAGIYVENQKDDDVVYNNYRSIVNSNVDKVNVVYVILTNDCNLRCTYCSVKNIAEQSECTNTESLTKHDIVRFIKQYRVYCDEMKITDAIFIFYGGEPLLRWELLKYFVLECESYDYDFKFSIVSNGTLLDSLKIDFIKEHQISLGLSVDGPKLINDVARLYHTKTRSVYDDVLEALKNIAGAGYEASLSITISTSLLDHYEEVIPWLRNVNKTLGIEAISYNLLRFQGDEFEVIDYYQRAAEFIYKTYSEIGHIILDDRINRKIMALSESVFFHGDCAAITGNQIVLKPKGVISVCQAHCQSKVDDIGNIYESTIANIIKARSTKYYSMMPIFNSDCRACSAIFSCGGGCYWEKDKNGIDLGYCEYSKYINNLLLEGLFLDK